MNKKITPKVIKIIALQAAIVILTVSVFGGAVITHQKYKATLEGAPSVSGVTDTPEQPSPGTSSVSPTVPGSTATSPTTSTEPSAPTESPSSDPQTPDPDDSQYPYAYAGFTPQITDTNADLSRFIVNGNYSLPAGYKPTLAEAVKGSGVYLDYRVAPYYQQMYDAAKADGITLTPVSGYRSYERQKNNFENRIKNHMNEGLDRVEATKKAATVVMVPGSSEHNAGLAMDICSLAESFENYKEFEWLNEHAAEYGFILRYPKDERSRAITGVVYEPWHYRFVGVEAAKEIKSRGITLEEYVGVA
ncbi:MAG: M15 family metallopeptidase [Clostridia bacterium]|nr:M15 family metallopeptidase [Clostridia bacterium]